MSVKLAREITAQIKANTRAMIETWLFECEMRFGKEAAAQEREHLDEPRLL